MRVFVFGESARSAISMYSASKKLIVKKSDKYLFVYSTSLFLFINLIFCAFLFHSPVWAAPREGLAGYREAAVQTPRYALWNNSTLAFEAEQTDTTTVTQTIQYVVVRESPTRNEMAMGVLDDQGHVNVQIWDGVTWGNNLEVTTAIGAGNSIYRGFDMAYEQNSGDLIVAYYDGTTGQISYSRWNGSWQSEGTFDVPLAGVAVVWIKMESLTGSDNIVIGMVNSTPRTMAAIWDGGANSFGNGSSLGTDNSVALAGGLAKFDVDWERSSGIPVIVYGDTVPAATNLEFWRYTGGTWQQAATLPNDADGVVLAVRIASCTGQNYIGVVNVDSAGDADAHIWDGSSWVSGGAAEYELTAAVDAMTAEVIDIAFEQSSCQAVAVYSENADTPRYQVWTSGSGWGGELNTLDPDSGDVGDPRIFRLVPKAGSDEIMMLVMNETSRLGIERWDGGAWNQANGGNAIETTGGSAVYLGFDFDYHAPPTITVSKAGTQPVTVTNGTADNRFGAFTLSTPGTKYGKVTQIVVSELGTVDADTELTDARLWWDNDGTWNGNEQQISGPKTFSTQKVTFDNLDLWSTITIYLYVDVDVAGSANGKNIQFEITAPGDITSPNAYVTGPPVTFTVTDVVDITVIFNNPAASSWQKQDFNIDITDVQGANPINCDYMVESYDGFSWATTTIPDWTLRACSSATSTITVGGGLNCRDQGTNTCRVSVRATDTAFVFAVVQRPFSIDWTAPTAGAVTPANTDTGTYVDGTFDLSATFNDGTGSGVTYCEYCKSTDGTCDTEWASGTWAAGTCSQNGITCTDGQSLTLNMRATDAAGNTGTGTAVTRTCDTAAPTAGAVTPANTDTGTFVDDTFDLSATFNDGTGSGVTSCEYCKSTDGTCDTEWAAGTWAAGTCSQNGITCSNGDSLTLNMRATDAAGYTGTGTAVTRTCDAAAPTAGAVTPANTDTGTFVDGTFDLSATFNDGTGSGVTSCEYCKSTDGSCDTEWAAGTWAAGTCSQNGLTCSDGQTLKLNMRATDGTGYTGTGSEVTRTCDTVAPTAGAVTPANTDTGTFVDGTFDLSATFNDGAGSGVSSCQYCKSTDGTCDTEWAAGTWAAGTCSQNGITCTDGQSLTLNMRATDGTGNTGTGTAVTRTCDAAGPAAGAVTPANIDSGTHVDGTFDLSATFNDGAGSGVTSCQYCKSTDGTCDTEWAAGTWAAGTCSQNGITCINGQSLTLNMRATDAASNIGTGTAVTRTCDTAAPTAGAITPANTDSGTKVDGTFDLSATFNDGTGSGVASCQYCKSTDGTCDTEWAAGTWAAGTCSQTGITCTDGQVLTLNMRATDATAYTGTGTAVNRTCDAQAPSITLRETADINKDGFLDAVKITFSENILDSSVTASDFDVQTVTGEAIYATGTANDNIIYISFTPGGVWNTGALPTLQYTAGTLTDPVSNPLPNDGAAVATTDKAPPVITNVAIGDGNGVVTVTFSENVTSTGVTRTDINPVGTRNKFGTTAPTVVQASNSATMTFTLAFSNTDATKFLATDVFNFSGNESKVKDAINQNLTTNTGAPTMDLSGDTAPPDFFIADKTAPKQITATFTEPFDTTTVAAGDFSANDNGTPRTPSARTIIDADTVQLTFTGANLTNNITLEMSAAGVIDDLAGDQLNNTNDTPTLVGDNTPPSIISRDTFDLNSNGYIDALHITFDELIMDSSVTAANFDVQTVTGEAFSSTTNGDTVDDADIYITFADDILNTGATPTLTYTAGTLKDLSNNLMLSDGPTAATDTASPTVWFIATMDDDRDGQVDMYKITLSESVTDSSFNNTKDTDSTFTLSGTLANPVSEVNTANDNIIYVGIVEAANNTATVGDYTAAAGLLTDKAPTPIAMGALASGDVVETDGAPPAITNTTTSDSDADGYLNTVTFGFSEAIVGTGQIGDWTLLDKDGSTNLLSGLIDADVSIGANTVTLTLADNSGTTGAATYTYTMAGGDNIRDSIGNETPNKASTATYDNAVPVVMSVSSNNQIAGGNLISGTIFTITLSENVIVTGGNVTAADFAVTGGSWHGGASVTYADGAGNTMTATLSSPTNTNNWTGAATFDRSGGALTNPNSIEDTAGNDAIANGVTNPTITGIADTTAPSISSISTMDDDKDGRLDAIKVTFSENVDDSTFTSTGWSITGGLVFSGSLLNPASESDTADDNIIYAGLNETAYNTGV
ncbi:MAG: hypothetical protein AB1546_08465, partial [bacterium]